MKSVNESLQEYGRGLIGGLLFSVPMLYTMELWWTGFIVSPTRLITYFVVGFLILLMYNHYVGIRESHSNMEALFESLEEMGMGLLLTAFILWITNRISADMPTTEIVGKMIVEAVAVAIGISIGKTQLSNQSEDSESELREPHLYRGIGIALCGALLVSSNVAPTYEIVVIALEAPVFKILIIALFSIALAGVVLYFSDFIGTKLWVKRPENTFDIIFGTLLTYAVALISSAFLLWFFSRFDGLSLSGSVAEIITLGFPSAIGASAGRLLIQW